MCFNLATLPFCAACNPLKSVLVNGFNWLIWFRLFLISSLYLFMQRITIEQIRNDEWFNKGYVPARLIEYEDVNLDDVDAAFNDPEVDSLLPFV